MRTTIKGLVCIAALLLAAQAGAARITIGGGTGGTGGTGDTDVGDNLDIFVASTGVLSGAQAEVDFVNEQLGTSFTKDDMTKSEDVAWYETDLQDVIAFALESGPGHYLVKNSRLTVLFENVADFNWGVIDVSNLYLGLGDDMQISHVSEFGGTPTTQVPEPGTLALLGMGLLGLGLARRRKSA